MKHDTLVSLSGFGNVLETAQIDAINHITRTRTDGAGRTLQTLDSLNKITTMQYDTSGNLLSVRDPNSVGWDAGSALGTFDGYDELNRPVVRIDTQGDKTSTAYDTNGSVKQTTDAKNQNANFTYDAQNRKLSQADRLSGVTTWKYDPNGNLLELCDSDNQSAHKPTIWTFDARNQKLTEALPGHNPAKQIGQIGYDKRLFAYDMIGRPAAFTDQKGDTVTHGFDLAGRLERRDYRRRANSPDGPIANSDTLAYDDAGRLLSGHSGRYNNTVSLAYDVAGRLAGESLRVNFGTARTYSVSSVYDAANRRTGITYPDASVVTRSYTGRDQLAQIGYNASMVASFAYDDGMRRITRTLGDTPGTVTTWSYGRSDNLVTGISTPNVTSFGYAYDANKNKLTETIGGPMQPYGFTVPTGGYDAENRLVGWNRDDSNLNQSWNLSLAGDWNSFTENGTQQARTHDAVHQTTNVGGLAITYDAKGNTTGLSGLPFQAVWDFDNRMQSATVGANTHGYTYDALGRRVSKTVRDGENAVTTVYVSMSSPLLQSPQAGQELAEYTANALPTAPSRKFVYGDYIDEPVMMVNVSGGTETKYYYHANSLYNVAALTDQSGTVQERYAYTAYGKPLFFDGSGNLLSPQPSGSALGNPYMYTGRRIDPETGLQYSRARYYEFDLGRFLGRDPIGYEGGINLYEYVSDSPVQLSDPLGTVIGCGAGYGCIPPPPPPKPEPDDPIGPPVPEDCAMALRKCKLATYGAWATCLGAVCTMGMPLPAIGCGLALEGAHILCDDAVRICNNSGKKK